MPLSIWVRLQNLALRHFWINWLIAIKRWSSDWTVWRRFYSGFIVADKIVVESRKAGESADKGVRWVSDGTGQFTTESIHKPNRGTSITLYLKDEYAGGGESETNYLNDQHIKSLVNKYSDHISLPIQMHKQIWQDELGEDGEPTGKGEYITTDDYETVNQANALWTKAQAILATMSIMNFIKT